MRRLGHLLTAGVDESHAETPDLRHAVRLQITRGGQAVREAVAPPSVPGLVLDRRLGGGEHGEVWRALDLGAVGAVAVQVGRPASGAGAAAREAALLRRIAHENVVHVRSVLDLPDGRRALVLDLAPGGDLEALVRRRGPLPEGEVVPLAIALARALEQVHALGFVHGRLSPREVLFAADGRPLLAGVGVGALLAGADDGRPPAYPSPQDDVCALGQVLRFALTGGRPGESVSGGLGALVAACTAGDAGQRPSPARVAALARDAAEPAPVAVEPALAGPVPPTEPLAPQRRRSPLQWVADRLRHRSRTQRAAASRVGCRKA
jgi:serine/threonine protein kinase